MAAVCRSSPTVNGGVAEQSFFSVVVVQMPVPRSAEVPERCEVRWTMADGQRAMTRELGFSQHRLHRFLLGPKEQSFSA